MNKLFISDSTKTIRLLALNFYAGIVDSGFGLSLRRNLELVIKLLNSVSLDIPRWRKKQRCGTTN